MKVKCIDDKNQITLLEGKEYTVESIRLLWNINPYIKLVGLNSRFRIPTKILTNIDGSDIKGDLYEDYVTNKTNVFNETVSKGDLVRCNTKQNKSITFGKIYTIRYSHGYKIELEEVSKKLKSGYVSYPSFSLYNFDRVLDEDKRDIILNNVLDDKKDERLKNYDTPYFEDYDKLTAIIKEISISREYLRKTKLEDTSLMEVLIRRNRDRNFLTEEDFRKIIELDWSALLYEK